MIGSLFGIVSVNRNYDTDLDTVAPPPPIFNNAPRATNNKIITLDGFSEEGTTIKFFVNGPEHGTTITTTDGVFTYEGIELINGRNTIFAKAVDASNNESEKSVTLSIDYDTKSPDIEIEEPEDGDFIKNLNKRVLIKGNISEKGTVTINDNLARVRPDFSFEYSLGVEPGEVEIKIIATDEAGNTKEETFKITYLKDS